MTVTGKREYTEDLPQGGLEIFCNYTFHGTVVDVQNLKKFFAIRFPCGIHQEIAALDTKHLTQQDTNTSNTSKSHAKESIDDNEECEEVWLDSNSKRLTNSHRDIIFDGEQLNDIIVDFSVAILQ